MVKAKAESNNAEKKRERPRASSAKIGKLKNINYTFKKRKENYELSEVKIWEKIKLSKNKRMDKAIKIT